ncbi:MAG: hypothetical protein ACOCVV_02115 [Marinobacter sp.]
MNKSLSGAITALLLVTSSAWGTTPEGQEIRPTGDNQPDPSPTEQAEQPDDPRPTDEERVKANPKQGQDTERPEDAQDSMKEYENPEAADPDDRHEEDDDRDG